MGTFKRGIERGGSAKKKHTAIRKRKSKGQNKWPSNHEVVFAPGINQRRINRGTRPAKKSSQKRRDGNMSQTISAGTKTKTGKTP